MSKKLKIDSCDKCPNLFVERHYTPDSFEMVFDWKCEEYGNKHKHIGFQEGRDYPKIPDWCPLEDYGE